MQKSITFLVVVTLIASSTSEAEAIVQDYSYLQGTRTEIPQTPGVIPAPPAPVPGQGPVTPVNPPKIDWEFTDERSSCCPKTMVGYITKTYLGKGKCRSLVCEEAICITRDPYYGTPIFNGGRFTYSEIIPCDHPIFGSLGDVGFGDF